MLIKSLREVIGAFWRSSHTVQARRAQARAQQQWHGAVSERTPLYCFILLLKLLVAGLMLKKCTLEWRRTFIHGDERFRLVHVLHRLHVAGHVLVLHRYQHACSVRADTTRAFGAHTYTHLHTLTHVHACCCMHRNVDKASQVLPVGGHGRHNAQGKKQPACD